MAKPKVIKLADKVDISKVENLLQELKEAAEHGGTMEIDASAVSGIDTAGLQLLFSVKKTLEDQGSKMEILDPSQEFVNAACLVGFDTVLALS